MSTFSPSLRIELITTGDQAGVWGNTTNTNLGTLVESAIAGYVSVSITAADQALTAVNGAADQSRNQVIALTTTTVAAFNVYAPPAEKTYTVYNASAYAATLYNSTVLGNTTAAGVGATIPAGKTVTLWSDGTNFVFQNNHLSSLTLVTDLAIADGGTGASTAANARTNLGVTATGADTTYAFRANNLSDLASAPTARTNLGLGTIATQNSSSVSITGGSITGITDLAVADGGTGASDAATARTNLGLGTMATQAASSVTITGGSITGITDLAVADGGTGASDAATARTNLAVPSTTGSGASGTWGISISGNAATATNATNATNATSATNATNATNATTSTTQAPGTNTTAIATTAFVQAATLVVLNTLHPVGSLYMNATNATNPATLLGFGTWSAFGAGRVPVGFNAADPLFDTAEETGGSKDAVVVSHTHTASSSSSVTDPGHLHSYTLASGAIGATNLPQLSTSTAGPSANTNSASTGISVATSTTVNSSGVSGTNANIQPYITVYMWKRTA